VSNLVEPRRRDERVEQYHNDFVSRDSWEQSQIVTLTDAWAFAKIRDGKGILEVNAQNILRGPKRAQMVSP
jgi:hypothetical protein